MTSSGADLTKYPSPVIIIMGVAGVRTNGGRGTAAPTPTMRGARHMRVMLYKVERGVHRAYVTPSRRAHLATIYLRSTDKDVFRLALIDAIDSVSAAEEAARVPRRPE